MTLTQSLERLADTAEYGNSNKASIRWGEIIRANASLAKEEARLASSGALVHLDTLGKIRGGVVTRANAYFLVRELPLPEIPARFHVTRGDLQRVAVVADGLDYLSKVERPFLRSVIKGPEALSSAFTVRVTDLRLLDVKDDKDTLAANHANGILKYLRRGETVNYKTSDDDLKGGIPALRSQVKNRKPYWYSLQTDNDSAVKIVFPEHIDRRYIFTLVPAEERSVVIDKLFTFNAVLPIDTPVIHAALNSLFTWYQVELRGRSQLGEGVLELKIPDYAGVLLANPAALGASDRRSLLSAFSTLPDPGSGASFDELGTPERHAFDLIYLRICGFDSPEATMLRIEQELRALAGERSERRHSVADAKVSRRKITNVAASVDAYAMRLASDISPFPDPKDYVADDSPTVVVNIFGAVEGVLDVGVELFDQGEVKANGRCIARAGSVLAAQFVRGALLAQPEVGQVSVPSGAALDIAVGNWTRATREWHRLFKASLEHALGGVDDPRTRKAIEDRALRLLHAA